MAMVGNGTGGNNLSRTTNLPTIYSSTMMGWIYPTAFGALNTCVCNGAASGGNFYAAGVGASSGNKVAVYAGVSLAYGTTILTTNTWYHIAITVAGTGAGQTLVYLNGVQEISTQAGTGFTAAKHLVGDSAGGDPVTGRVAAIKLYNGVLTADQIKEEMRCYAPVNLTNLLSWHPLFNHTDTGQYGTAYTIAGTVTTAQGPPIPWTLRPARALVRAAVTPTGSILRQVMQHMGG